MAATGLVELSVLRRGRARIKYGRFTCLNPDRAGGLVLRPLPVTERPLASLEQPQRYVRVSMFILAPSYNGFFLTSNFFLIVF